MTAEWARRISDTKNNKEILLGRIYDQIEKTAKTGQYEIVVLNNPTEPTHVKIEVFEAARDHLREQGYLVIMKDDVFSGTGNFVQALEISWKARRKESWKKFP